MSKKVKKQLTEEQILKKERGRVIAWTIVWIIFVVFLINIIILPLSASRGRPLGDVQNENKYIVGNNKPLISAHRAGGSLAPEETLLAFEKCMEPTNYKVDIVEFDLHITKDGELILLHDGKVDRTSNSQEVFGTKDVKVKDKTLEELKTLNFGENFVAPDGSTPYKGLKGDDVPDNVKILELDTILAFLTSTRPNDLYYIIEIKDGGKDGEIAMDKLHDKMVEYNIVDKTIVGTFQNNVTEYIDKKYPELTRSGSILEVLNFYYSFLYGVKPNVKCEVLQIPKGYAWIDLTSKAFIDYAHSYGMACQYWTINDKELTKKLIDNGADAIITDNPEEIYSVIYT